MRLPTVVGLNALSLALLAVAGSTLIVQIGGTYLNTQLLVRRLGS